jgi:hypothetical protein
LASEKSGIEDIYIGYSIEEAVGGHFFTKISVS